MDLNTCLQSTPYRSLAAIATAQNIARHSGLPRADLVALLCDHLSRPSWQGRARQQLSGREEEALQFLAQNDSQVPRHAMEQRFGVIRPYRPWRPDSPKRPWQDPVSPAEALHYKGMIYPLTRREVTARGNLVVLPQEFRTLAAEQPAPLAGLLDQAAGEPPVFRPLLDLALLLTYLQQNDVAPIHGRWLSPYHFRRLGACLSPSLRETVGRTELQAGRLPFVHYLAESLGLISVVGAVLKPVPGALTWLAQPQRWQFEQLWQAWLSPDEDNCSRWQRFRLPALKLRDPVGFANRLVDLLRSLPAGPWRSREILSASHMATIDALLPWWEHDKGVCPQDLVDALLQGPLTWLGVVHQSCQDSDVPVWRISETGRAMMNASPPSSCDRPPQWLALDDKLRIEIPAMPRLESLLSLAHWADLEPGPALRLTPKSLAVATARGGQIDSLLSLLPRHVRPAPTDEQRQTLVDWAAAAAPLHLKPALLLQTGTATQMAALCDDRGLRDHLGERLAPDLVAVRSSRPQHLRRLLARRGHVIDHGAIDSSQADRLQPPGNTSGLDPGSVYWLAVAAHFQTLLAHRFGITAAPPGAVLDQLSAALGPAQASAADADAQAALALLEQTLADRPAWLQPMPEEEAAAVVQNALSTGALLRLRYWSPWEGRESQRCVQPLRMQWRGDHRYLDAFCHLAQANRTFRLDRVLEAEPCSEVSEVQLFRQS